MKTLRKSSCGLVACALAAFAAQASAEEPLAALLPPLPAETVRFHDLDLSRPADLQVLYYRLRTAAHRVCERENDHWWDVGRALHERLCIEVTVDNAVRAANNERLTALHRSGKEPVAGL